jgi:hypothetical protein
MRIRTLACLSILVAFSSLVMSAASEAAPTVPTAGTSKPMLPSDRPTVTVDPRSRPHVSAVRARTGDNGLPVTVTGGAAFPYEVDVKNPTNAEVRVTIDQDNTGSYPVTVPASSTKAFRIAHAVPLTPCIDNPIRSVWLQENDAVKLKFSVEPNCALRATAPAVGIVSPAPGKVMYTNARIKSAPRTCSEDLVVEATVTNGTNAAVNARLTMMTMGRMNEFTLTPGQNKTVAVGGPMTGKSVGPKTLTLLDQDSTQNPTFVAGSWAADVTSTCRPAVTVVP